MNNQLRVMVMAGVLAGGLTGCVSDGGSVGGGEPAPTPRPPSRPYLVESGSGELRYRAGDEGRVWVENLTRGYQVTSFSVKRNDEVRVKPSKDEIEVNGQTVYGENLEKNHEHGIFFRANRDGGWWGGGSGGHADYGGIPSSAERVASGYGTVRYRADARGTVWIGNDKLKKQIVSAAVQRGDEVEVSPGQDQVKVNGRVIFDQNMESKHQHSVFFK